jgi:hypothetical protein
MAKYLANLTNGQLDEKGIFRLIGTLLTQSGVVQSGALSVAAQSTPDMTVKVAGASTGHDIVFITSSGDTYHGWNTANENVTITSNASGVTKTDAIVAYADLSAGIATSNNPGALKFVAVRRSGSDTGNPTSGEISSAVSSNPYVVLAYVTVSNGASSINSGNITDARTRAYMDGGKLSPSSVTAAAIVTIPVKRQNNTTNSDTSVKILTGWGYIQSLNGTTFIVKAVTFGVTFSSPPIVTVSNVGLLNGSNPDSIDDFNSISGQFTAAQSITTTGFNVRIQDVAAGTGNRFGYSWIAIGEVA